MSARRSCVVSYFGEPGELVGIHAVPNQYVPLGHPLASVESSKAIMDVTAPYAGVVTKVYRSEGDRGRNRSRLFDLRRASGEDRTHDLYLTKV